MLRIRDGYITKPPEKIQIDIELRKQIDLYINISIYTELNINLNNINILHFNFNDHIKSSWYWWKHICNSPRYVLAPMIGQSDFCFRILCRKYNVNLCYTPMYMAERIICGIHDIEINTQSKADRPLIIQLAGNNKNEMIKAGLRIQKYVDGIDINFGCPQKCAEYGQYGSFYF